MKLTHKLEKKYQDYDNIAVINRGSQDQLTDISFVDDFIQTPKPDCDDHGEDATDQLSSFGF